jgi:hypothetical protein
LSISEAGALAIRAERREYADHLFSSERQRRFIGNFRRFQVNGRIAVDPLSLLCETHERSQPLELLQAGARTFGPCGSKSCQRVQIELIEKFKLAGEYATWCRVLSRSFFKAPLEYLRLGQGYGGVEDSFPSVQRVVRRCPAQLFSSTVPPGYRVQQLQYMASTADEFIFQKKRRERLITSYPEDSSMNNRADVCVFILNPFDLENRECCKGLGFTLGIS